MKIFALKSNLSLFALLFLIGALAFQACEKDDLSTQVTLTPQSSDNEREIDSEAEPMFLLGLATKDIAELEAYPYPPEFEFDVAMTMCKTERPKVTLRVLVNDVAETDKRLPERFRYAWIIDGVEVGKTQQLDCVCAKAVTVTVERMSDHQKATRTIRPWLCYDKPITVNYEEQ